MTKRGEHEASKSRIPYRLFFEEFLLLYLLWSDISGYFGVLPADFEYVDKLIAWVVIGLLLYHLSLTKLMFGHKNPREDILIIIAFFLLVLKNNFVIIKDLARESIFLTDYFKFMLKHIIIIEKLGFYAGGILIILIAFYTAKRLSIRKPSIMHLIHEEGEPPKTASKIFARFITVFLVLVAFFIMLFNLFIEWIGYLGDDAITLLSIILAIIIIRKHTTHLSEYRLFRKINTLSEKFIDKIFESLESRRHVFIALSGILVLHLLTDFVVFIMPLLIGQPSVSYLGSLDSNHPTLFSLAAADIAPLPLSGKFVFLYLYAAEFIAITFLMAFPLYIWYLYYAGKEMKVPHSILALFLASLLPFFLAPIFRLSSISKATLLGVDIRINPVSFAASINPEYIMMASLVTFILVFIALHYFTSLKKALVYLSFIPFALFMLRYVFLFLKDLAIFYLKAISGFLHASEAFFLLYFALFLILTVLFYGFGTIYFLYEAERKLGYFAEHIDRKFYKGSKDVSPGKKKR
ncbi:hypothetical protein HYV81_01525 [Candidatus Woesearchaeota archaeon]|nr:hypothetical protein [Candidatus Woesearchaeota archaeon]